MIKFEPYLQKVLVIFIVVQQYYQKNERWRHNGDGPRSSDVAEQQKNF
jgi:hypothetical protein